MKTRLEIEGLPGIATDAVHETSGNIRRLPDGPDWSWFGVDHRLLAALGADAGEERRNPGLWQGSDRRRQQVLAGVEAVLAEAVRGDGGDVAARRRRLRRNHAFAASRLRLDPLAFRAVVALGADAIATFALGAASRLHKLHVAHPWGNITIAHRDGTTWAGAPLGPGVRLTRTSADADGRHAVQLLDPLPETVVAGLAGEPLSTVLRHPLLDPLGARITSADNDWRAAPGDDPEIGTVLTLDVDVAAVEWREAKAD